jgi:hypothetical protein
MVLQEFTDRAGQRDPQVCDVAPFDGQSFPDLPRRPQLNIVSRHALASRRAALPTQAFAQPA